MVKNFDDMFGRFDKILQRCRQTDRHHSTAHSTLYIASRDKNERVVQFSRQLTSVFLIYLSILQAMDVAIATI